MRLNIQSLSLTLALVGLGCAPDGAPPLLAPAASWGPEQPFMNLEVVLRGNGFGLVKFRQPNDDDAVVYLDTWVRNLTPLTTFQLQRAVDTTLDGVCSSAAWLTLGKGLTPHAITTDENGTGRESLFRAVPPTPGVTFDIHFRVIEENSGAVVLQSACYEYTISL